MDWQELLQELIQLVENTAPVLWAIFIKQVYVNALQQAIAGIIGGGVGAVLFKVALIEKRRYEEEDDGINDPVILLFLYVLVTFASALSAASIVSSISRVINPEFYAIEMLINYVR